MNSSVEGVKNKTLNCQRTSNYPGHRRKKRLEGNRFAKIKKKKDGERKSRINARSRKECGKCSLILRALFSLNKLVRIGPAVACAL